MSTIDIKLCIGALADDNTATATLQPSPRPLERKDEFVANVIWRFLNIRGWVHILFPCHVLEPSPSSFLPTVFGCSHCPVLSLAFRLPSTVPSLGDHSRFASMAPAYPAFSFTIAGSHRPSPIGHGLHTALVQSKVNDRFQEPLFIVLELVRMGVLHGQKFGNEYLSGGPVSGASEQDQASSMLIMRCLSVLPLNFRVRPLHPFLLAPTSHSNTRALRITQRWAKRPTSATDKLGPASRG